MCKYKLLPEHEARFPEWRDRWIANAMSTEAMTDDDRAVDVLEHPSPPAGMRILYALLDEPTMLIQDADEPHGSHMLDAGYVEFRIAREYDPFAEQARIVAD